MTEASWWKGTAEESCSPDGNLWKQRKEEEGGEKGRG
jgi:hypothetical protein